MARLIGAVLALCCAACGPDSNAPKAAGEVIVDGGIAWDTCGDAKARPGYPQACSAFETHSYCDVWTCVCVPEPGQTDAQTWQRNGKCFKPEGASTPDAG